MLLNLALWIINSVDIQVAIGSILYVFWILNYTIQFWTYSVFQDIFRKYPNKYESIIATLCENLDTLDEPEARASMIWIIGEYAERIDNADELLESFLEGFQDENTQVGIGTFKIFVILYDNTHISSSMRYLNNRAWILGT